MISKVPLFFKRRFYQGPFENQLMRSMQKWIDKGGKSFADYQVNVINDVVDEYFWSLYNISIFDELELGEIYSFEDFVSDKYGKIMREYWFDNN